MKPAGYVLFAPKVRYVKRYRVSGEWRYAFRSSISSATIFLSAASAKASARAIARDSGIVVEIRPYAPPPWELPS